MMQYKQNSYCCLHSGTLPGVQGAPADSIAASRFFTSTSTSVFNFANRVGRFTVEDWLERRSRVHGLPYSAGRNGDVPLTFIGWIDCNINDATRCQRRTDGAKLQSLERRR